MINNDEEIILIYNLIRKKSNDLVNFQSNLKIRNNINKYFSKIMLSLKSLGLLFAFLFYLKWGFIISLCLMIIYYMSLKLISKEQNNYLNKNYPLPNVNEQQLINQINYLKEELEKNKIKNIQTLNKVDTNYFSKEFKEINNNVLVRQLTKK